MSVRGFVSQMNLSVTYIENALFGETILFVTAVFRSYLRQFSMQMKYIGTACTFMQVIHVLRYHMDIELILKGSDFEVGGIWAYGLEFFSADIVEIEHQSRIFVPSFDRGNFLRIKLIPKSAVVTECAYSALCAHTGAGKYYKILFHSFTISMYWRVFPRNNIF